MTDDGSDDVNVLNWADGGHGYTFPPAPGVQHRWIPYEPHTLSMEDEFTNLYHETPIAAPAAKNPESDPPADDEDEDAWEKKSKSNLMRTKKLFKEKNMQKNWK